MYTRKQLRTIYTYAYGEWPITSDFDVSTNLPCLLSFVNI